MRRIVFAVATISALSAPGFAIVGVGVHYGIVDITLRMDDKYGETLDFISFNLNTIEQFAPNFHVSDLPAQLQSQTTITGDDIPILVDRTGWKRSPLALGGKVFIDIIPIIDAIEVSANYGMWEYQGQVRYPSGVDTSLIAGAQKIPDIFTYDTVALTLDGLDMGYGPLHETPYAKLTFDLTIRKNLVKIPKKLKVLRIYLGGGFNAHFATPMLSTGLIEDALGTELSVTSFDQLIGVMNSVDNQKKILTEITCRLFTPHFGMHIVLGTMVKIPVVPLGFYVDGKLAIPFGAMDENVDLGGFGVLVNGGITLAF